MKGHTIALVTNTSWNVWNFRRDLIEYLTSNGYRIIILSPQDKYSDFLLSEGYSWFPLKKLRRKGTNPFRDVSLVMELKKLFSEHNIDLALLYTVKPNIYGTLAAWMLGKPSICTLTGLGYSFGNNRILSLGVRYMYKVALQKASKIVFQNPDDADVFIRHSLASQENVTIIPGSGINLSRFEPVHKPEKESCHFLFVGRMLRDKGIFEFCEAASIMAERYEDVQFTILCKADEDNPASLTGNELRKMQAQNHRISICQNSDDVRPYLADCDVYVLPSYREGLPKSTLEAMAMAKPVITTDVPGCRETVKHLGNGWLIAPKNTSQLVEAMEEARLAGHYQLKRMGDMSRKIVESKFSNEHILNKYISLITQIQYVISI